MNIHDLQNSERTLIIHHWDADGVCSAALLTDYLSGRTVETRVPTIGIYHLSQEIRELAKAEWDSIVVADINLPVNELLELKTSSRADMVILDHHIINLPSDLPPGFYHPSLKGIRVEDFPSSTWLITTLLESPVSIFTILGAIADKGTEIMSHEPVATEIGDYLEKNHLTVDQITRILDLLESNYRMGRPELVQSSIVELRRHRDDPLSLLKVEPWQQSADWLEREIQTQSKMPVIHRGAGLQVQHIDSSCDIVSAVGRRLARSGTCGTAIVLNTGFLKDYDQLYVRQGTRPFDSRGLIALAHQRGFSAGGKNEVVGIVLPKTETDVFMDQITDILQKEVPTPN